MTRSAILDMLELEHKAGCVHCGKAKLNIHAAVGDLRVAARKLSRADIPRHRSELARARQTHDHQIEWSKGHLESEHGVTA